MDIMDLASKLIVKVTSGYGNKIKKTKSAPEIAAAKPKKYSGDKYNCGFAMADINPPVTEGKTLYIAGHGSGHVMEGQITDVFASAMWLGAGDGGILWISADIVGLTQIEGNLVREKIKASSKLPEGTEIIISATHSHSGIDTIGYWGKPFISIPADGKDADYMKKLIDVMADIAVKAYEDRKPGKLFRGSVRVENSLQTGRIFNDLHPVLYRIKFVPDDGSKETWLVNFGGHPNTLGGANRMLSGEYPYFLREKVNAAGANLLFGIGAIGGMDCNHFDDLPTPLDSVKKQGAMLGDALLTITNDTELEPNISITAQQFYLPVDNNVLTFLAIRHTMSFDPYPSDKSLTGIAMKSIMMYLTLGNQKILTLPGENFISTVYGNYCDAETSTTGKSPEINPAPLAEIANDENLIVFGVTNDMTGYVVPPNDWVLNPTQPFLNGTRDRFGKNHYHETNSMGVNTQKYIAENFKKILSNQ